MELNNITNTGTWGEQATRLNDNFNKVALGIDTLQSAYQSLSQSAIEAVDTLPQTGEANKIYRLVGTTSYSDYMYNTDDLTTPILMATYNNAIENEPTPGSNNLVKSGGVAAAIVFDISAYHATGSTLATYADLTSALGTNGANVPSEVRKGGMSIKFVQTSDNKYVQYRLMSDTFNTTPANWQGVDDEPTSESPNLIKSSGVYPFAKKTDDNTTILNTIPEFLSESKGVFENSFFENTESTILHTTSYPTNTNPGISQFYHEMEVTERCFVTRITVNISALVSCDVDVYLLLKPIKNYAPLSHSSKRNITGDDSVELIINSFLLPNVKYYIYIKASTDNALKWTGNGLQSDLVRINGTYWKQSSDGDVSLGSLSTNIGLLGNVYSKGAVPNFTMESGNIIVKNRLLGSIYDAEAVPNVGIVISDGQITQHHEGSGNTLWEVPFKAEDTIKNFVRFVVNVTSITGTGRVWVFAYNTSNQKIYISIGFISAIGEYAYDVDLNYYAVYNQLDLTKRISVGVANFTDEFDAVYNKADVTDNTLQEVETPQELNSLLENLQSDVSKATNKQEENVVPCLVSPNNTKYYLSVDNTGNLLAKPVIPSGKMLIIGNSLLYGFNTFGMCASDSEHDYYWKIRETLLTKSPGLSITRIMGTPFEECTTQSDAETWMDNTLGSILSNDYTLAIIQLGDNVNNASRISAFRTNAKLLINYIKEHCPNARIAWAGEWYSTVEKQKIIKKACNETGADFIDISMIRSEETEARIGDVVNRGREITQEYNFDSYTDDNTNHVLTIVFTFGGIHYTSEVPYTSYTVNGSVISVTGEYTIVTNSGVASHPGDAGMLAIANRICYLLGITDDENEIS